MQVIPGSPVKEQGFNIFGALVAIVGGWSVNEWVAALGAVAAIVGHISSRYYQRKREKREEEQNLLNTQLKLLQIEREKVNIKQGLAQLDGFAIRIGSENDPRKT